MFNANPNLLRLKIIWDLLSVSGRYTCTLYKCSILTGNSLHINLLNHGCQTCLIYHGHTIFGPEPSEKSTSLAMAKIVLLQQTRVVHNDLIFLFYFYVVMIQTASQTHAAKYVLYLCVGGHKKNDKWGCVVW